MGNRPDIFRFDQITSYNVDLNTRVLNEEERKNQSSLMGVLNFFLSDDFGTRYPDLPRCPSGCKVTGMYFQINLGPNPLHAKKIRIDMLPGWSSADTEIEKAYLCANSIYQCIKEYQNGSIASAHAAAPSGASQMDDTAEQLKKLKELLDSDIITQADFDAKKKQLLGI